MVWVPDMDPFPVTDPDPRLQKLSC
jgi:hypothetical protein